TLFWAVVPVVMQPAGAAALLGHPASGVAVSDAALEALKAFGADRAPFSATLKRQTTADAAVALSGYLAALDAQLADGRGFLLGAEASIADFSVAHNVWFIRRAGPVGALLDRYPALQAWHLRVGRFGHGTRREIGSDAALTIAASAAGHAATAVEPGLGFDAGAAVTVAAIDYGVDPVAGTLVGLSADEVVLRRDDERVGTLHVHFPRVGFQIRQERKP
ncbi:MAG: glutathione S-transferase domain-containing protein, partial [Rubrivivax sp.]